MQRPNSIFFRFLEIVPASLVWLTLIFSIVLSFIRPLWVIYFIIVFYLFWLLRIIYFFFYIFLSFAKYKSAVAKDWMGEVKQIENWTRIRHIIYLPTDGESLQVLRATFNSLCASDFPLNKMIVVLGG